MKRGKAPGFLARAVPAALAVTIGLGATAGTIGRAAPAPGHGTRATPVAAMGPPLAVARVQHTATVLGTGGKVLVAGGQGAAAKTLASAELYDAASNTWSAAKTMSVARQDHTATLLTEASGRVLVVGGAGAAGALASAELYNPAADSWTPAGTMGVARQGHTATLLNDGRVLIVGGSNGSGGLSTAELYTPVAGTWTPAGSMSTARQGHTATLLKDGRVLVAGGRGSAALATAEVYDPPTNSWSKAATMTAGRFDHTATRLADGRVLAAGGQTGSAPGPTRASAELYDPGANAWTSAGSMKNQRAQHTATLLSDGRVLIAGGSPGADPFGTPLPGLASSELFDPPTGAWTPGPAGAASRQQHTASRLGDGRVLLTGGTTGGPTPALLASSEFVALPRAARRRRRPVFARSVDVAPVRGRVLVKVPGSRRHAVLSAGQQIPVGSTVDTQKGTVRLTSARSRTGALQSGDFYSGVFRITQRPGGRSATNLILTGGNFRRVCGSSGARSSAALDSRNGARDARRRGRRRRRRTVRRLWGSGRGSFGTRGRFAAAAVRGTRWLTADRCDGTLISVRRGTVTVRDFSRRRTVKIGRGRSYLARARPRP